MQSLGFNRAANHQQQMFGVNRFLQKIESAIFHRLNRFINRAIRGQNDHWQVRIKRFGGAQDFQPSAVRHAQVGQDQLWELIL